MEQGVLIPDTLPEQLRVLPNDMVRDITIPELFEEGYREDPFAIKVLVALRQGHTMKEITVAECTEKDGFLYYWDRKYLPRNDALQLQLIQDCHDMTLAGHPGRAKTFDHLSTQFYWKDMRRQVDRYVRNCGECQGS